MPVLAVLFPAAAQRGFQMIDGVCTRHFPAKFAASVLTFAQYALVGSKRGTILEPENHPAVSRNEAIVTSILSRSSENFDDPRFARPGRLCVGYRHRRDGLERSSQLGFSGHSSGVAGQRRRVLKTDRAGARDPCGRARPFVAGARRRRRALPDRVWGADQHLGAGALDRGDRLLVRRRRRQAGARPRHRPCQQRAPRPRRATPETVAQRPADRRTQPHPSGRIAGRGHRGSLALPLVLRLHADRHRSSGAHQRCLRLRCRGRGDFGSGAGAFARGCAAATCSAGSPATNSD